MAKKTFILPENLEEETKDYISCVISYLKKNEQFNVIDSGALQMLTTNYDLYIKARNEVLRDGITVISDRGNRAMNPAYNVMKSAIASAMDILKEFGLTLKSRSKLNIITADTEESPLLQFIEASK